jgi:hypothetical protein
MQPVSMLDGAAVELFEDMRTHAKSLRGDRRCRALFTTYCVGTMIVCW